MSLREAEERLRQRTLEWYWNHYREAFGEIRLPGQDEVNAILSDDTLPAPERQGVKVETQDEQQRRLEIERAVAQDQMEKVRKLEEHLHQLRREADTENRALAEGMDDYVRPSWDQYYIDMLPLVGARATCNRGRSGCIITNERHRIIMTGYVGAPPGMDHCDEVGHKYEWRLDYDPFGSSGFDLEDMHRHCIRTIHAEANAIYTAAYEGVALKGSILYCTMTPCQRCAEAIVQSGIKRVVTAKEYHNTAPAVEYFQRGGVQLITVGGRIEYEA